MKKEKRCIFALIVMLLLVTLTSQVTGIYTKGDFWSTIDNTLVTTIEGNNVNIGENDTTTYKLKVNGTSFFNDTINMNDLQILNDGNIFLWDNTMLGFNLSKYSYVTDIPMIIGMRKSGFPPTLSKTDLSIYKNLYIIYDNSVSDTGLTILNTNASTEMGFEIVGNANYGKLFTDSLDLVIQAYLDKNIIINKANYDNDFIINDSSSTAFQITGSNGQMNIGTNGNGRTANFYGSGSNDYMKWQKNFNRLFFKDALIRLSDGTSTSSEYGEIWYLDTVGTGASGLKLESDRNIFLIADNGNGDIVLDANVNFFDNQVLGFGGGGSFYRELKIFVSNKKMYFNPFDNGGLSQLDEIVFNDDNEDVDIRISGNIDDDLFNLDAGNDKVTIGNLSVGTGWTGTFNVTEGEVTVIDGIITGVDW